MCISLLLQPFVLYYVVGYDVQYIDFLVGVRVQVSIAEIILG